MGDGRGSEQNREGCVHGGSSGIFGRAGESDLSGAAFFVLFCKKVNIIIKFVIFCKITSEKIQLL